MKQQLNSRLYSLLLVLPFLLLFIACQEPLGVDYAEIGDPVLLVEGKITTDTTKHYVFLSKTKPVNESGTDWETDATVTITNNGTVIPLTEEAPGHYYTAADVFGIIGEEYNLQVELSNGEIYEASTYIQNNSEIDSVKFLWEEFMNYDYYTHNLYFHGWEQEEEGNAYLWNVYLNDTLYNDTLWKTTFVNDDFVNGNYIGIETEIVGGDTILKSNFAIYELEPEDITTDSVNVLVEMESLPIEYYDFWITLMQQTEWIGGPFDPAKADPLTNISNGGIGYFYGASVVRKSFVYYPPEESKGFENRSF